MVTNMDYSAKENVPALDVYEKLDERRKQSSLGKLVGTMYHIDTKMLPTGNLRVQGWIELDEFLNIMQGEPINMLLRINGNKVEIWCLVIDSCYFA